MVDMHVSEACAVRCAGSSPAFGTKIMGLKCGLKKRHFKSIKKKNSDAKSIGVQLKNIKIPLLSFSLFMSSQKLRVGVFEKLYVSCSLIYLEVSVLKKLARYFSPFKYLKYSAEQFIFFQI